MSESEQDQGHANNQGYPEWMTVREKMAMEFMSSRIRASIHGSVPPPSALAEVARMQADALLKELRRKP